MAVYRHCTTENSAERQHQFENALLELMGQRNYSQIAIMDICGRVGLSRKSFYRYFSSKDSCLCAMVDRAILEVADIPNPGEPLSVMLERYFESWSQKKPLLDVLSRNELGNLFFERSMACAAQEFGIREYLHDNGSSYTQTIFFLSGLTGVLLKWHQEGFRQTPAQLAGTLADFLPQPSRRVF